MLAIAARLSRATVCRPSLNATVPRRRVRLGIDELLQKHRHGHTINYSVPDLIVASGGFPQAMDSLLRPERHRDQTKQGKSALAQLVARTDAEPSDQMLSHSFLQRRIVHYPIAWRPAYACYLALEHLSCRRSASTSAWSLASSVCLTAIASGSAEQESKEPSPSPRQNPNPPAASGARAQLRT